MQEHEFTENEKAQFLAWITESTERASHQVLRKYRNYAVAGFLLLCLGIGYVQHIAQQKSYQSRGIVCQIIKQGDYQTYIYQEEGTINETQLRRSLALSQKYRKLLAPAKNCDTNYTTKPKQLPKTAPSTGTAPRDKQ